jgi:hypothetical protein
MNQSEQGGSGWTVGKVLAVVFGLISMVGFGFCSLCGVVLSIGSYADAGVWLLTAAGAVLAALSGWLVVATFRKVREQRERK